MATATAGYEHGQIRKIGKTIKGVLSSREGGKKEKKEGEEISASEAIGQ